MTDFIQAFGLLIIIIVCIAFITKLIRQPIIIGYVIAGLFFSYFFASDESIKILIEQLSTIGITLLLFLMGFEFDFKIFKSLGRDLLILTLGQTVVLLIVGAAIAAPFGFTPLEVFYLSLSFSLCSTLLVAKWIEDKKETNALHGKLTLGILVFQDIIAILCVTFLTVSSNNLLVKFLSAINIDTSLIIVKYFFAPLLGFILLGLFAYIMSRHLLNFALKSAAQLPELLLIFSISICFIFAQIAMKLGYSETIGAFIGGVVIANTIYKADISARLKPLVTFFNMLFFVGLGFETGYDLSSEVLIVCAILVAATLIIKPIVVYISLRLMQYDLKTSFITSIHLSPLSEFGIILITGGVAAGQVSPKLSAIVILSTIITMVLCSYTIKYDKLLWNLSQPTLSKIDKFIVKESTVGKTQKIDAQVAFFGYYESGKEILQTMRSKGKKIVVITNDPEHVDRLEEEKIEYYYGGAVTPEFFEHIVFSNLEMVVSSHSDLDESKFLISQIKSHYPQSVIIVTARNIKDSLELYKANADYVLYPAYINEKQISILIDDFSTDINKVIQKKVSDMARFEELLTEKIRLNQKNKIHLARNFFEDVDQLVGKLGHFQKINERTLFHLFNKAEIEEKLREKLNKKNK